MDVEFNEETGTAKHGTPVNQPSALVKLVISTGMATDQKGAEKVLIGIFIVAVLVTAYLLWPEGVVDTPPPPDALP